MNAEGKNETSYLRLFLGSFVDIQEFFDYDSLQENLKDHFKCPIRYVERPNLHMTWKFIGNTNNDVLPEFIGLIKNTVSGVSDILINFNQFEIWPNSKAPRQLVITGKDLNGNATEFYNRLNAGIQKFGIKKEKRKFNPHITLARFKLKEKPEKRFILPEKFTLNEKKINFKEIVLIKSILGPKGSTYKEIKKFNL